MNKLFELLDTAMKTGDMIVRIKPQKGCCYAIRYFPEREEFLCVNHRTGEKVPKNESGFVRVNLSKGLLDGGYLLMRFPKSSHSQPW